MSQDSHEWVYWRFKNKHEDLGAFGESLWKNAATSAGLFYVELAALPIVNRRGPRLQNSEYTLPDFELTGQRRAYLDSKCKTEPVLFRLASELRHGIDRKAFDSYEAISGINRQKCFIGIVELFRDERDPGWSGALLMQSLASLGKPISGMSNQRHMVYWPRAKFEEVGKLRPLDLWNVAKGESEPPPEVSQAVKSLVDSKSPPMQSRFV